jgi:peptidoglycan/LPS O-acetylase OafA/YrhL
MSADTPGSRINLEIEYLRATAILLVFLAHLDALFPELGLGQWTGVDLFFCISGYVISRSFQQSFDGAAEEGRWKTAMLAFWTRRFFRLTPSAWLWLTVMVVCSFVLGRPESKWFGMPQQALEAALTVVTFTTNFALGTGNIHTSRFFWSLTLEDQFYFIFPFYLLLFRRHWRWMLLLFLIYLQSIPDRSLGGKPTSLLWVTRLDALMWGCLIYQFSLTRVYRLIEPKFLRFPPLAFAIAAILVYCLIIIPKGRLGPLFGYKIETQVALASAALVFLASYGQGYVLPLAGPFKAVFAWIGSRSYALYLVHLPVFGILSETWFRIGPANADPRYFYAVSIAILVPTLAELNFRLLETPLRERGARIARRILNQPDQRRQVASPAT